MSYEKVAIYRSGQTVRYIVQPMTRHPSGASAEFGEPTEVSEEEFDARIVSVVLENLGKYHQQKYDPDLAKIMTDEEDSKFRGDHDYISVTREDSGLVEVIPGARTQGGYVGIKSANITLQKDEVEPKLGAAIREAFRSATRP